MKASLSEMRIYYEPKENINMGTTPTLKSNKKDFNKHYTIIPYKKEDTRPLNLVLCGDERNKVIVIWLILYTR